MNNNIYDIESIKSILVPKFQKYGVVKCGLIGSYARGEATPVSDIDLLFKINKSMSLMEWETFEKDIRDSLDKDVDFIEFGAFSPRVEKEIQKELIIIYEQTR